MMILSSIFSLILLLPVIFCARWVTTNRYLDLESTTEALFAVEASNWQCTRLVNNNRIYSNCGGVYLLGGYNIMDGASWLNPSQYGQYFYRTYTGLPAHNQLNLTYTVYAVDSWDGSDLYDSDRYDAWVDGQALTGWRFSAFDGYASQLCGGTWNDFPPVRAYMTFPHSTITPMNLRFISYLDQSSTDESLGIRDIELNFTTVTTPVLGVCGRSNGTPLPDKACPCATTNEYMRPPNSGTCFPCHATCKTCNEATLNDCLSCYDGTYLRTTATRGSCPTCNVACTLCTGPNNNNCQACADGYFLVGTTCYPTCDYPLYTEVNPRGGLYCRTPCPGTGNFAYWNANCSTSCPFPLVQTQVNTFDLCVYPCDDDEFLYWDRSCGDNCLLPLIPRYESGKSFCDYLCQPTEIMYWDGMCSTDCPYPLDIAYRGVAPYRRRFCTYQCDPDQFLYWDDTCSSECPAPLKQVIRNSRMFCEYPCDDDEYLYWDGSCQASCDYPLDDALIKTKNICNFPCTDITQYLHWDGTCSDECPSPPLSPRAEFDRLFCDFPCTTLTDFAYWDGTCDADCPEPWTQSTEGTVVTRKFCLDPCEFTEYVYWDGSCEAECFWPLTADLFKSQLVCGFPCTPQTDFLYWNGNCGANCLDPYDQRETKDRNFCDFPCDPESETPYLYSNGTCIASCESPRILKPDSYGFYYCDFPCADQTDVAYPNGTCEATCETPAWNTVIDGTRSDFTKFCVFKCGTGEYLNWNNVCQDSCQKPYRTLIESDNHYCQWPCDNMTDYYYPGSGFCNEHCHAPYLALRDKEYKQCIPPEPKDYDSSLFNMFLKAPLKRGAWTVVTLVKPMQYVRYLDIDMPPRLQRLGISRGRNVLSFSSGITMWGAFENDFTRERLNEVYERSGLHSSFLVNFWEDLMTIFIAIFVAFLLWGVEVICSRHKLTKAQLIFERLRIIALWNWAIMVLAINIDNILLFSLLEFKTFGKSDTQASSVFSLLMCLFFFIGIFAMMFLIFYLIKKQRKSCISVSPAEQPKVITQGNQTKTVNVIKFHDKWSCVQVVYNGFTQRNIFTELFFVFYMLRIGLPILIAVLAEKSPLTVSIFQVLISIGVLTFLIRMKPFKKKINHIQILLFEVIIFMMNLWMFLLTIMSVSNTRDNGVKVVLGDLVIVGNDCINLLCLAFLVLKLKIEIDNFYAILQKNPNPTYKEKTAWLLFLSLPLQQAYMGFEEMVDDYNPLYTPSATLSAEALKMLEKNKYNSRPIVKKKVEDIKSKSFVTPRATRSSFFDGSEFMKPPQDWTLGPAFPRKVMGALSVVDLTKRPGSEVPSQNDLENDANLVESQYFEPENNSLNNTDKWKGNRSTSKLLTGITNLGTTGVAWRSDYLSSPFQSPKSDHPLQLGSARLTKSFHNDFTKSFHNDFLGVFNGVNLANSSSVVFDDLKNADSKERLDTDRNSLDNNPSGLLKAFDRAVNQSRLTINTAHNQTATGWRSDYLGSTLNSPSSEGLMLTQVESLQTPVRKGGHRKSRFFETIIDQRFNDRNNAESRKASIESLADADPKTPE